MSCKGVFTLDEAKKKKNSKKAVENRVTKVEQTPLPPTTIRLELTENYDALEELHALVRQHHGRSEVSLVITSKLVDVKMQTFIKINPAICKEIEEIDGIEIIG
jgi:DNA polymerase-3 subunit alpha